MKGKKLLAVTGMLASVGIAGVLGLSTVSADTGSPAGRDNLISKIAEKFNLEENEVQAVFDEHRDEMHAGRRTQLEERLTQAVSDGKLTEDQKSKVIAKFDEFSKQQQDNRENFQSMDREERREAMEQRHEELEKWAEDNDIPEEYLRFGERGRGQSHGRGYHLQR